MNPAAVPTPLEDVQGDGRWLSMVRMTGRRQGTRLGERVLVIMVMQVSCVHSERLSLLASCVLRLLQSGRGFSQPGVWAARVFFASKRAFREISSAPVFRVW